MKNFQLKMIEGPQTEISSEELRAYAVSIANSMPKMWQSDNGAMRGPDDYSASSLFISQNSEALAASQNNTLNFEISSSGPSEDKYFPLETIRELELHSLSPSPNATNSEYAKEFKYLSSPVSTSANNFMAIDVALAEEAAAAAAAAVASVESVPKRLFPFPNLSPGTSSRSFINNPITGNSNQAFMQVSNDASQSVASSSSQVESQESNSNIYMMPRRRNTLSFPIENESQEAMLHAIAQTYHTFETANFQTNESSQSPAESPLNLSQDYIEAKSPFRSVDSIDLNLDAENATALDPSHSASNSVSDENLANQRPRSRLTRQQTNALKEIYNVTYFPDKPTKDRLCRDLDINPRTLQIWFQNQRQYHRLKLKRQQERAKQGNNQLNSSTNKKLASNNIGYAQGAQRQATNLAARRRSVPYNFQPGSLEFRQQYANSDAFLSMPPSSAVINMHAVAMPPQRPLSQQGNSMRDASIFSSLSARAEANGSVDAGKSEIFSAQPSMPTILGFPAPGYIFNNNFPGMAMNQQLAQFQGQIIQPFSAHQDSFLPYEPAQIMMQNSFLNIGIQPLQLAQAQINSHTQLHNQAQANQLMLQFENQMQRPSQIQQLQEQQPQVEMQSVSPMSTGVKVEFFDQESKMEADHDMTTNLESMTLSNRKDSGHGKDIVLQSISN